MTVQLNVNTLFNTFNVTSFNQLEQEIGLLAPSMVEYYLKDLSSNSDSPVYVNKSEIQQTIYIDEYSLFLDYDESVFLEFNQKDSYDTESFW